MGYNSVPDNTGLSLFVYSRLLPSKSAKSHEIPRKFELIPVQGQQRSSIVVPVERAYATSY